MPRKVNSFDRALADAEKRLAKALNERDQAQTVLNDLALEIPSLQQTISALQHQLSPQPTGGIRLASLPAPDLYKDFKFPPVDASAEDDLLPEVEGTPLLPED
jgi:hypothetical protein